MAFAFTAQDIERISETLETPALREGKRYRFDMRDESSGRRVTLEIYTQIALPDDVAADRAPNLVSVMGPAAFHQLQGCTGFRASGELGEVIFFARVSGITNALIVEKSAGSSMYANVDDRLLERDFTQLAPELMMSSVALSLTDNLLDDL